MAFSVNKVILIGKVGKDPELKQTDKGSQFARLSVATNEFVPGKNGAGGTEYTTWHNVTVWGKKAENCAKFLHKGSTVYLEGKIHVGEFTGQDGQKRRSCDVWAEDVLFLSDWGNMPAGGQGKRGTPAKTPAPGAPAVVQIAQDEDIPF